MVRKLILLSGAAVVLCAGAYGLARWRNLHQTEIEESARSGYVQREWDVRGSSRGDRNIDALPPLDARAVDGVWEITKPELVKLMTKSKPLSGGENANLDRGCPGFVCVYQGLGLKRWPEAARGTVAYLRRADALKRRCPVGQENFIFVKQGCWLTDKSPTPDSMTGEVPINSVTRSKPGFYTFNYAVYFPSTETYAWINHRDYGFPVNRIRPQKAYLSRFPPPLNENTRPAQIYCSTCR
jgi:hypothetical protein